MIFTLKLQKSQHRCEDDASVSSTLTVERLAHKQLLEQDDDQSLSSASSHSFSSVKSVRFNSDDNQEYENKDICKEDTEDLWYSNADYKRFKSHTHALAKEVLKSEARNRAPFSYERVMLRTYEVCSGHINEPQGSVLTSDERRHMVRWAEVATSRLGLEKWAIKSLGRERAIRRVELVDIVLDFQSIGNMDGLDECIREHCERISRPSRLFAREVALAQAAVIEKDNFEAEC
jgi:hypothetical protein